MDTNNVTDIGSNWSTTDIAIGLAHFLKTQGLLREQNGGFAFAFTTGVNGINSGHVYNSLVSAGMALLPVIQNYVRQNQAAA